MRLLIRLVGGSLLVSFVEDCFMVGFWVIGLAALVRGGLVFRRLRVECVNEYM